MPAAKKPSTSLGSFTQKILKNVQAEERNISKQFKAAEKANKTSAKNVEKANNQVAKINIKLEKAQAALNAKNTSANKKALASAQKELKKAQVAHSAIAQAHSKNQAYFDLYNQLMNESSGLAKVIQDYESGCGLTVKPQSKPKSKAASSKKGKPKTAA